jgi:hypothetical protein
MPPRSTGCPTRSSTSPSALGGIVTGLAAIEPDPRAPDTDVLLDAALMAATGLQQLLAFRHACTTATTAAEQQTAMNTLTSAVGRPQSGTGLPPAHQLVDTRRARPDRR